MPYTYKGISPSLIMDTSDIQNNTPTSGSKYNISSGKMSSYSDGVCATLTSFWLGHAIDGDIITKTSEFPSAFQISIAQASYIVAGTRTALMDRFGVSIISRKNRSSKWYSFKKTKFESAAAQAVNAPGFYYLSIRGDGGHAIGIATKNLAMFFDPNYGLFQFSKAKDIKTWLPAFIADTYKDLMDEVEVYAVG